MHAPGHEERWHEVREAASEQAIAAAIRLLGEGPRRAGLEAPVVDVAAERLAEFATGLGHELAPGQDRALADVLGDMASERPIDRMVCGDVGFDRTEVALRAAYAAVEAGLQVAVATPTTVLCRQHFHTFAERFGRAGVNVASLCGHDDADECSRTREGLADGGIDIVVGTQAVLAGHVEFGRLGPVIVDEEHRFGVAVKERAAALQDAVHVLSLSATPIPRTLGMGLAGVRDLSIIGTAPGDRRAVRTRVAEHDPALGHEAVAAELARGGQAFWPHDRIESIDSPTVVDLGAPPAIAEADVPDAAARLARYLRIASAPDTSELDALRARLVDDAGPMALVDGMLDGFGQRLA